LRSFCRHCSVLFVKWRLFLSQSSRSMAAWF
jgi:hypothetical protein